MADPTKYDPSYSFSGFQANNPDEPLPAAQVDTELANVALSVGQLVDAVKDVRRSDGALKNGIVTLDSLAPDVSAQIGDGMLEAQEAAEAAAAAALVSQTSAASSASTASSAASTATAAADAAAAAAVGLKFVTAAVAATTGNITLSGEQTIDGVAVTAGQRVLVKNQSSLPQNGVYVCSAGAWSRSTDADAWAELISLVITASGGTVNGGVTYISTTTSGGTLGVTDVVFTTFNSSIIDGAVTTAKIADGAVTTAKLASNAVTTAKITDANVTTAKIADANVTTAKIADANVTTAKIADSNVTTAKIADSNVTSAKLASGAVTAAKLAAAAVSGQTAATIAAADSIVFTDASDSGNLKTGTVQDILNLATGTTPSTVSTSSNLTFSVSSAAYTDVTGLTGLSVTPASTSQKVKVSGVVWVSDVFNTAVRIRVQRSIGGGGATTVFNGTAFVSNAAYVFPVPIDFLDNPATTSACSYSVQISHASGSTGNAYVNRDNGGTSESYLSTLTAKVEG